MKSDKVYIYGKHALREAVAHAPGALKKVYLAPTFDDRELLKHIDAKRIPRAILKQGGEIKDIAAEATHQGVIGVLSAATLMQSYDSFIESLRITPETALVVLGELQDPQNVGAIIRSSAAFGISGILIPEHNQAPITGAVVKVSAGMAFRIPLISIGNVNQTLRDLKERGFWVYGLDAKGTQPLSKEKFEAPTVFVLGNEGTGLREKTGDLCDVRLSIPMSAACESLNVAASAAVVFYAWSNARPRAFS
jgi:23S rRNA (guanosine2251-2'-O)-methyltransferase